MAELTYEVCPETGIMSISRGGTDKTDLMPDEVAELREMADDPQKVRAIIAESDSDFAAGLTVEELAKIIATLK